MGPSTDFADFQQRQQQYIPAPRCILASSEQQHLCQQSRQARSIQLQQLQPKTVELLLMAIADVKERQQKRAHERLHHQLLHTTQQCRVVEASAGGIPEVTSRDAPMEVSVPGWCLKDVNSNLFPSPLDPLKQMQADTDDQHSTSVGEEECDSDGRSDRSHQSAKAQTTLMVRNVPVMYTQEMLLHEWPNDGSYDFLYLPRSGAGRFNLSYAFINFVSEAQAEEFRTKWQKKRLAFYSSKKALNISYAEVQGREANLAQLKKKRVRWQSQSSLPPTPHVCC